jgi:hypothetical protein
MGESMPDPRDLAVLGAAVSAPALKSNLPAAQKTQIASFWDSVLAERAAREERGTPIVEAAGSAVLADAVGGATGAGIAALEALAAKVGVKVPVDLAALAAANVAGVAARGTVWQRVAEYAAAAAAGIAGKERFGKMPTAHGEDELLDWAKDLGA